MQRQIPHIDNNFLLIFDLDDTLIDTSDLYWRVREEFIAFIYNSKLDKFLLEEIFESIDTVNTRIHGYKPIRYNITMQDTFIRVFNRVPNEVEREKIRLISEKILLETPRLIEGAIELLEWSKEHFEIGLITRGRSDVQKRKIEHYNLSKFFGNKILIVEEKNADVYEQLIAHWDYAPKSTIIIGDSLKSDINPALEIGAEVIYYKYTHHTYKWLQEYTEEPISSKFHKIRKLSEAKSVLQQYIN